MPAWWEDYRAGTARLTRQASPACATSSVAPFAGSSWPKPDPAMHPMVLAAAAWMGPVPSNSAAFAIYALSFTPGELRCHCRPSPAEQRLSVLESGAETNSGEPTGKPPGRSREVNSSQAVQASINQCYALVSQPARTRRGAANR
jgi:hypothetical protein